MKPSQSFFQKYLVTIVMIPSIIGIHIGWNFLQKNPTLVKEEERIDLPIITGLKYMMKRIENPDVSKGSDPK
ncbi:uncharacterized protein LOC129610894 [Condylostylus longicornis]|uniref:uncharacterized protein LOC129610894 n=1 Tax=Condylostylus longicornis TaxID=2530218 RepID=UPI00244E3972|nr:uncharacterized protein LOC129610894 [Condylostylus longicornis]XP_055379664.1 uncharacterized protein LOC129610894 [Condylostylus longicornis]